MGQGVSSLATGAIGAATSLAASALTDWMNSIQLSHDADTATTLIVNGLAQQLANLDSAYLSEPNPTCATQRAALDAYDSAWAWLQSPAACGNPSYGSAGNRCISDRAPGGPTPWATYYRDPIANDPRLASAGCDTGQDVLLPSITTGSYADTGITSTGGSSTSGQTAQEIAAQAVAAAAAGSSPRRARQPRPQPARACFRAEAPISISASDCWPCFCSRETNDTHQPLTRTIDAAHCGYRDAAAAARQARRDPRRRLARGSGNRRMDHRRI